MTEKIERPHWDVPMEEEKFPEGQMIDQVDIGRHAMRRALKGLTVTVRFTDAKWLTLRLLAASWVIRLGVWLTDMDAQVSIGPEPVPADVERLVIAAREVAFGAAGDIVKADGYVHAVADLKELDDASEAFSTRVAWEDQPEDGEGEEVHTIASAFEATDEEVAAHQYRGD